MSAQEPEQRSPAAGACVVVLLAGTAFAAVFAASTAAGVLAVWMVGALALVRAASRKGPDLPLPSPTDSPSHGDVYAGETGAVDRVQKGPGALTIVHPVREEIAPD